MTLRKQPPLLPRSPVRHATPIIARVGIAAATHRIIDEEMGTGGGGKAL
jgi:hypothetical protein